MSCSSAASSPSPHALSSTVMLTDVALFPAATGRAGLYFALLFSAYRYERMPGRARFRPLGRATAGGLAMQSAVRSARYIHSCLAVLLLGLAIGPGVESQEPSVGPDRVGYTSLQP